MDYTQLIAKIDAQKTPPILYLFGEENELIHRALSHLRQRVVTKARDFNLSELDAREHGIDSVVLAARTLPMMSERRLVIATRADEVKGEAIEPLLTYASDPAPQTVLVLVAKTLDQRTRLGLLLRKQDFLCECVPLKPAALAKFVANQAKLFGLELEPEVNELLSDAYGTDLAQWLLALDRFSLYLGGPGRVDDAIAAPLVLRTRAESVFTLTDAVIAGKTGAALALGAELAEQKESPIAMVALVARQVRQLIVLKEALDGGAPGQAAARTAGIPPFVADRFLQRAKQTPLSALLRAHARLTDADMRLKSSPLADSLVWFGSLWEVIGEAGARG